MQTMSEVPRLEFQRPFGRPRSELPRLRIAQLDARKDCQEIVRLLVNYEFPFDLQRSLEVALFHTYGSRSVSRLLDKTGEFRNAGQKRYDDTRLLIAHFLEAGFGGEGGRAISRMNHIHSFYKIPNDDYLFVLWTFIDFPIAWLNEFGYRPFSAHESEAWFAFWVQIGERMGVRDIPHSKPAFDAFVASYEAREFVPSEASARVAQATLDILGAWFPAPLRGVVAPAVLSLVRPQLLKAIGKEAPPAWFGASVRAVLRLRAWAKRYVSLERYPSNIQNSKNLTYPGNSYSIETLGPEQLKRGRSDDAKLLS